MEINNKKILITGAGAGIGKETVKLLIAKGAFVIGVDINEDNLAQAKTEINSKNFVTYKLDVSNREEVLKFKELCNKDNGEIDCLINNAGVVQPFVEYNNMDQKTIDRVMNINFFGPLALIKVFLPELLTKKDAHIVNVSSMAGFFPFPKQSIYGASKAALKIFSEGLYAELSDTNVGVTVVMPGAVATDILKNSNVEMKQTESKYNVSTTATDAANEIVKGIEKKSFQVYIGKDSKMMNIMYKFNPKKAINYINKKMKEMM